MKPEPWEQHWKHLEAAAANGEQLYWVAKEMGLSLMAFQRQDKPRKQALMELAETAREALAERRGEQWAVDPDADPRMRLAYLKAESAKYRRSDTVTVNGDVDVHNHELAAAVDRFTQLVAAATVRHASSGGEELAAGDVDAGGSGGARVPVAELAGPSEPAAA